MKFTNILIVAITLLAMTSVFAQSKKNIKQEIPQRVINVDYNVENGTMNTMFKECIGAGRANEGLRADWQQQLAYVKKECDFKYIRMHGLLCDDMAVYSEDNKGNPEYNYQYIDALFDYLESIGIKPFVELGFMPSALASGTKTIFWWRGNVTPPKDYNKWGDLIRNLTAHFTERYGAEEVKTWYFEVWNEPNLNGFWAGTQEEYFKLYQYSVNAIKSVNPLYKVGGPATAGAAWVPEMISFCSKNNLPIDFISTHSYGVKQGFLDEHGNSGTVLSKDPMAVSGDILKSHSQITSSSMSNLELHYTEWSSSYTPADPVHDSYHEAAYILEKIKQVGNAANSMSYWVFTDIFEESGPRFTPFHGGFGLLTIQGINKSALYSYKYMNKLGKTELVNTDTRSWACKSDNGDIQLLFWDFTNTHPGDSVNNQAYYIKDLPSRSKGKLKVSISHVPVGMYTLETYKVGYRVNDAYTDYLDMDKPKQLNKQQVEELKRHNAGSPIATETIEVKPNTLFSKELDIRENDVFLLNLIKH